jgi:hypothetical protein
MHGMHGVTGSSPVSSISRFPRRKDLVKKRFIPTYLLTVIPIGCIIVLFAAYEIVRHGFLDGIVIVLLSWSAYILCIPAAHGRFLIGAPSRIFFKYPIFPEAYFWCLAVFLNATVIALKPELYTETIPTTILHRVFITPSYWPLFAVAAAGTWYRIIVGMQNYRAHEALHTLMRHLILLGGLGLLLYMVRYDLVIAINVLANG